MFFTILRFLTGVKIGHNICRPATGETFHVTKIFIISIKQNKI